MKSDFKVLLINPKDNVATALEDIEQGGIIYLDDNSEQKIAALNNIKFGHKVATANIAKGEHIFKYGEIIGVAVQDIAVGEHVHVHNVDSQRGRGDLAR